MGVIIDEFEVVLDAQQDRDAENNSRETETAAAGVNSLKPHDINAVFEQQQLRLERVRAH